MKFKRIVFIAGAAVCVYWLGKLSGARIGAKAVLDNYADAIPDDVFTVTLVKNAVCEATTTVKKSG